MAITYTWKILNVKTRTEGTNSDVIVQTYWEKKGIDENGNTGMFTGATPFSTIKPAQPVVQTAAPYPTGIPVSNTTPSDVVSEPFIPFNQLTEEIVLGWIQSVVTGDYERHVNEQIQKQIDHISNPIIEPDLPWASANNG
jgi:hypothetical protein